jgi:transposase
VQPSVDEIKDAVAESPIIHNDETGTRVEKKNFWAHVSSTALLTYIAIHCKRGREAMDAIGVLLGYCGTAIHDCLASYFTFEDMRHGLCNAHLLRELTAVVENTKQVWAQDLIELLLEMKAHKEKLIAKGNQNPSQRMLTTYNNRYDELLTIALEKNPIRPKVNNRKPKRGKTGALVDRLILRKDEFLLFFADFSVPFDNNQAERDIRMFKTKQKVSGCFRTVQGAEDYATIMSYVGTARKNGLPAFLAIRDALLGSPFSLTFRGATE